MSAQKSFAVTMIGILEHERGILKNIFKLSLYRAHTYTLIPDNEPGQIVLVDAEDSRAMAEWQALRINGSWRLSTAIMIASDQPVSESPHWIRRPFIATRVLGVLDQVAAQLSSGSAQTQASSPEPATPESSPVAPMPTALVVDDSGTVRKQIELELKRLGVRIDAVESGEQAIEFLARNSYDLIFLDVILPGMDGYRVCKTIKKDKNMKKTPVVMLTSKSSPFDRVKGALAGCDSYLTKPVKPSAFQDVVKKYLQSSS